MPKGQCNCGAVTYQVDAELADVYICHCSICRRATGSGGIAVTVTDNKNFRWLEGEGGITHWKKPCHVWETSFCKVCGSPLPAKNSETSMYIPVSTLISGDENLRVAHHIWVGSKAHWEQIGEDGKRHEEAFKA